MNYDHTFEHTVELPCGARGVVEEGGIGVRCMDCFTVYGSISNPCYRKFRAWDLLKDKKNER